MRACSVFLFAVLITATTFKPVQGTANVAKYTNVTTSTSMNKHFTTRRPNRTTTTFVPRTYKSMYEFLFKCSAGSKVIMTGGMFIGFFNTLLALIYCCVLGVISREL